MRNIYHFALKTRAGELVEQDRPNWYVEEFLADQMLDFGRTADEFEEVFWTNTIQNTKSITYSIHSDNWEELMKKLVDELEGRLMVARESHVNAVIEYEKVRNR